MPNDQAQDRGGRTSANLNQLPKVEERPTLKHWESGRKCVVYPIADFLLANVKVKVPLKDLVRQYLKSHVEKPSDRTFQRAANRLAEQGLLGIDRQEQLWLIPNASSMLLLRDKTTPNDIDSMLGRKIAARVHSTHKIKLSMPYVGDQPLEGAEKVRTFGRYNTAKQAIFHDGTFTIGAYRRKLVVWVRNPQGISTEEQRVNAKAEGFAALNRFARSRNIALQGYLEKVELSHHVVENEALNEALKTLTDKYGEEIYKRLGTHECQTSHKGRIEHEGRAREDRIVHGDLVAIGLERLTLDFPHQFEKQVEMNSKFADNLALHLEVLQGIKAGIDKENELREETLKALKALKRD
jgi:hypothetical protein